MKYSLRYKGLIRVEFYWTFHFPASNSINPYLWKKHRTTRLDYSTCCDLKYPL